MSISEETKARRNPLLPCAECAGRGFSEETKARQTPRNPNGMPISKCARCAGDIICELLTEQQWQALCDNLHKPHIKIAFMEKIWWHLDGDKGCCGHEDPLLDLDSPER